MNCRECEQVLQAYLDGVRLPARPELAEHLDQCSPCRELHQAGQHLVSGLQKMPLLEPSLLLTERIVSAVRTQRRQRLQHRQRWLSLAAAVAALVLLPLSAVLLPRAPDRGTSEMAQSKPVLADLPQPSAAPSLNEQVEEARAAMTRLTNRLSEQARVLWEAAGPVELPPVDLLPDVADLEPPLHPAAESLQKARAGVSAGWQTVANSAQRAVSYFVREIPDLPN